VDFGTFRTLLAQRRELRQSWERLLRIEKTVSPLAHPDALVHLLDTTLDEVFWDLAQHRPRRHPSRAPAPHCPCGRNPLLAYYAAGRQALREALVGAQAVNPELTVHTRDEDLQVLNEVFDHIARREIESFCAVCQFRGPQHAVPAEPAEHPGPAAEMAHAIRSR
jgi:hypothetical protein